MDQSQAPSTPLSSTLRQRPTAPAVDNLLVALQQPIMPAGQSQYGFLPQDNGARGWDSRQAGTGHNNPFATPGPEKRSHTGFPDLDGPMPQRPRIETPYGASPSFDVSPSPFLDQPQQQVHFGSTSYINPHEFLQLQYDMRVQKETATRHGEIIKQALLQINSLSTRIHQLERDDGKVAELESDLAKLKDQQEQTQAANASYNRASRKANRSSQFDVSSCDIPNVILEVNISTFSALFAPICSR